MSGRTISGSSGEGDAVLGEPSHRIFGGEEFADAARRIFQRGFHGVPAVEDDRAVA